MPPSSLFTPRSWLCLAICAAFLTRTPPLQAAPPVEVPNFDLPKWNSSERVRLDDFSGGIVVLDFFAYWCAPCKRASDEIERGIQKYYAQKGGNPHGVPVRVVAINIEKDNPKLTAAYIKETGLELVLNDFDGALLEKLGGAGTPFLVILDGTQASRDKPTFRVLHQSSGFAGTKRLRQVIETVKPPKKETAKRSAEPVALEKATDPPATRTVDASFETMLASDVRLTSTALSYGEKRAGTDWKASYTHNTLGADYRPFAAFDLLGHAERLSESYDGAQGSLRQKLGDSLALLGSGGGYSGYTDYRSLWLANYYRQQFAPFFPGEYSQPSPQGFNASGGLRWEYQPTTGFVEAGFAYSQDRIAPGYELPDATPANPTPGPVHSRETLHTYSTALKFENVLTPRLRALNEFQINSTTDRELRYSYRGSLNIALGEHWIVRATGGYTHENPTLRAWFAGSTLEYELAPGWLISLSGLYYRDTGEIENSLFISTAAPGLATYQGGLGVRYAGKRSSFKVSCSPVWSRYEAASIGTRPFTYLYRDRTWIALQTAWTFEF